MSPGETTVRAGDFHKESTPYAVDTALFLCRGSRKQDGTPLATPSHLSLPLLLLATRGTELTAIGVPVRNEPHGSPSKALAPPPGGPKQGDAGLRGKTDGRGAGGVESEELAAEAGVWPSEGVGSVGGSSASGLGVSALVCLCCYFVSCGWEGGWMFPFFPRGIELS